MPPSRKKTPPGAGGGGKAGAAVVANYTLGHRTSDTTFVHQVVTAAAQVLTQSIPRSGVRAPGKKNPLAAYADWQQDVLELYDEVGELHYGANWVAKALSRIRLVAARTVPGDTEPDVLDEGEAVDLVSEFAGGPGGQSQVLARGGLHLFTVGETMIVGLTRPNPVDGTDSAGGDAGEEWRVCSRRELTEKTRETWQIDDGTGPIDLSDQDLVIRAWQPHAVRAHDADAATRSALPVLREARALTQHVSAQVDSRLAGAGLLLVPSDITFPAPPGEPDDPPGSWWFENVLMPAMLTPIKERDSAAAVVPILLTGPGEALDRVKHLTFSTPLDTAAKDLRDEALRRVALALDLPVEVVLGVGENTNHWTAWQIDEAAVRIAIAPVATILCHALTIGWLRPALEEAGVAEADQFMVWFDTSPLTMRTDRSEAAVQLYDRYELSGDALRGENGFGPGDQPAEPELSERVRRALALASPVQAGQFVPELLASNDDGKPEPVADTSLDLSARPDADTTPPAGPAEPDEPAGPAGPVERSGSQRRALPEQRSIPPAQRATMTAAALGDPGGWDFPTIAAVCETAVYRMLEHIGHRLVGSGPKRKALEAAGIPPVDFHVAQPYEQDPDRLVADAWADLRRVTPPDLYEAVRPVLDRYVRRLLNTCTRHTRDDLYGELAAALAPCPECEPEPAAGAGEGEGERFG